MRWGTLGGEIHHAGTWGGKPGSRQISSQPSMVYGARGRRVRAWAETHTSFTLALGSAENIVPLKAFLCSPSEPFTLAYFCSGHARPGWVMGKKIPWATVTQLHKLIHHKLCTIRTPPCWKVGGGTRQRHQEVIFMLAFRKRRGGRTGRSGTMHKPGGGWGKFVWLEPVEGSGSKALGEDTCSWDSC